MLSFVFPGQGSQSVGMLAELAEQFPLIQKIYQEASDVLGYDLWSLTQKGPEEQLNQTEHTQPALLAASVALFKVWEANGGDMPVIMAGHSLGEYSALVCADAMNYRDAISLVALRGRFMQQAVKEGEGAMAAIVGLNDADVLEICAQAAENEVLSPANYNAIGQTVLAGQVAAIERAIILAKEKGAKLAKKIPVSVPSHCVLMKSAAEKLEVQLKDIAIKAPKIPVINNVDVKTCDVPEDIRQALVKQLYMPVRWVETVQHFARMGVTRMIECGPGKVLAGLNKRIEANIPTISIGMPEALAQLLETNPLSHFMGEG